METAMDTAGHVALTAHLAAAGNLADVVDELGFAAAASKDVFRTVLGLLPRLDEAGLAQLLGRLTRTHVRTDEAGEAYAALQAALGGALPPAPEATLHGWNAEAIADAVTEAQPELDWSAAAGLLDYADFFVPDARSFEIGRAHV